MKRRTQRANSIAIALAAMILIAGCRTSQQSRRNASTTANTSNSATTASDAKMVDSLLLVQNKLVTVIDTMAGVITQDRHRIADLEREVARLRSLMESRSYSAPRSSAVQPPPVMQQPMTTPNRPQSRDLTGAPIEAQPQPAPQNEAPPVEPIPQNDDYTAALRLFNDGKYIDALAAFDDLTRTDATSPLAPNYLYWKGESLYAMKEYAESIRTFHSVLEKYPQSTKADDAEYKIAASYEKLGDVTNAKTAYQRLILSFPESEYRARAEVRLKKLK